MVTYSTGSGATSQEVGLMLSDVVNGLGKKIDNLTAKMEEYHRMDREFKVKLLVMISKMYHDGEINRDTFNKLDDFLSSYYQMPYSD